MDAKKQLFGNIKVSIKLIKSVESFKYEGSFFTYGWSHLSTNCEIGSVILLQLDTMGLIPIGVLCIFFRKYNLDVRVVLGGLQNSNHASRISPLLFNSTNLFIIPCLSSGDMSLSSGLYMLGSLKCTIAFLI